MADGTAGIAIALATAEAGEEVVQQLLTESARGLGASGHNDFSLFHGSGGLLAAVKLAGRGGQKYERAERALTAAMCARVDTVCAVADEQIASGEGMEGSVHDLVSGVTGWAAALSLIADPVADLAVQRLLKTLVDLVRRDGDGFPMYTGPAFLVETARLRAPSGHIDCGVAHGVSGTVGLLAAIGPRYRASLTDLEPVLADAAGWLSALLTPGARGPRPPARLGLRGETSLPTPPEDVPAAWCYGAAGMARAVWLAGRALDDRRLRDSAVHALSDLHLPAGHRLREASLCHGLAGLLMITWLVAQESGDSRLRRSAISLLDQLLDSYDEESVLGYRTVRAGVEFNDPGFISGTAGILALFNAVNSGRPPGWGRLLAVC
ncbi:lanthionine synthetase LanC family protein [Streptomyces sp. NPDC048650]|uniref:lanthionine synthetase LanC family protein n=1 Tax=unclassified Streptomyces TaxID=2593676 RepID=UPI00371652B8